MIQPDDDLIDALYDVLARTSQRYLDARKEAKLAEQDADMADDECRRAVAANEKLIAEMEAHSQLYEDAVEWQSNLEAELKLAEERAVEAEKQAEWRKSALAMQEKMTRSQAEELDKLAKRTRGAEAELATLRTSVQPATPTGDLAIMSNEAERQRGLVEHWKTQWKLMLTKMQEYRQSSEKYHRNAAYWKEEHDKLRLQQREIGRMRTEQDSEKLAASARQAQEEIAYLKALANESEHWKDRAEASFKWAQKAIDELLLLRDAVNDSLLVLDDKPQFIPMADLMTETTDEQQC